MGHFFLLFVLLDIGIPGSPSFVAEFIAFIAVVQESFFLSLLLIGPILMGVGVSLLVCSRVLFGLNDQKYFLTYETIYVNFLF